MWFLVLCQVQKMHFTVEIYNFFLKALLILLAHAVINMHSLSRHLFQTNHWQMKLFSTIFLALTTYNCLCQSFFCLPYLMNWPGNLKSQVAGLLKELREFDKRSKHFPQVKQVDHFINSLNLLPWWCMILSVENWRWSL